MRAEDHIRASRDLVDGIDENHAAFSQVAHHMLVMNNFVKHVERRPMPFQRPFHGLDRHLDTGAKTARLGQNNFFDRHVSVVESGSIVLHCQSFNSPPSSSFKSSAAALGAPLKSVGGQFGSWRSNRPRCGVRPPPSNSSWDM